MQISKLDAAKLSQETTIKDLKANIISLQSKLNKLESEHDELGKKFSSHTVQADSEIKQLQQVKKIIIDCLVLESLYTAQQLV